MPSVHAGHVKPEVTASNQYPSSLFFFFGSFVCFTSGSCGLDKLVEPPKENRVILMSLPATGGRRDVTKHFFHDLSPRILEHAHMASPLLQESRSWRYSFPDLSPWRRTFQEWRACHLSSSSASSSAAPWTEQIQTATNSNCAAVSSPMLHK